MMNPTLRFQADNNETFPDWKATSLVELATVVTGSGNREDSSGEGDYIFFDRSTDERYSSKYAYDCEAIIVAGEGKDFPPRYYNGKFGLHQRVYAIHEFNEVDGKYLYYYIGHNRNHFLKTSVGTTMPSLRMNSFHSFPIALPSLPEQRRIADALSAVDDKIDLLTRKRDNLARFKAGLMQKIFSQEVRFTREDGSAYPDWEEKELGDIAIAKTSSRSVGSIPDEEGNCAVYGATGIITRITSYDVEGEHIGIVKDGAGAGRVMMCEAMSSITGTMVSLTAKTGSCLRYLHQYLQTIDFSSYITGSTIPHIYFRDYKHERSNHPCWEEQVRISSFLDSVDSRVALVDEKISTMQAFKKGLLQQMFV